MRSIVVLILLVHAAADGPAIDAALSARLRRVGKFAFASVAADSEAAAPEWPTRHLNLILFGGDPTGVADSSAALDAALQSAINGTERDGMVGAGGVVVDLVGGTYLISRPMLLHGGKFRGFGIRGGTLFAGPSFPPEGLMLDCVSCSMVFFEDLTIDMQHRGGCMRFDTSLQTTVSNLFCLHYSSYGILGSDGAGQGHELLVRSSFFAEFMWGEPGFDDVSKQNGTAIFMLFPDSNFYDIIIRCTRVGVINRSGANLYHGLHIYATCNKAPDGGNVSLGMLSDSWQTRISNCYFDDSPLVVSMLFGVVVEGSLFYGLSGLIVAPLSSNVKPRGLFFSRNVFSSTDYAKPTIHYDARNGSVAAGACVACVIANNEFDDEASERTTAARAAVTVTAFCGTVARGSVDFSARLMFMPTTTTTSGGGIGVGGFDWQATAGPVLRAAADRGHFRQRALGAAQAESAAASCDASAPAAAATIGGVISHLHSSVVLTEPADAGGSSMPLHAVYAGAKPGLLGVTVSNVDCAAGANFSAIVFVSVDQQAATSTVVMA